MKKLILTGFCVLFFSGAGFAARNFIEDTDFFVEFTQKEYGEPSVLRINFIRTEPTPQEAELLLKDQLNIYGKIIEDEKIELKKAEEEKKAAQNLIVPETEQEQKEKEEEEEEKFKNIIGSVWLTKNEEDPVKIKFNDYLASYVYIGKTKKIVQFPDYITFLKKERDDKKAKDKLKAAEKVLEINTL